MTEQAGHSLADRLNPLFATVKTRGGQECSDEHVAAACSGADVAISQSYIWQLRKNKRTNPTLRHLQALADFSGVPAAYFFADEVADRVEGQLRLLVAEQEPWETAVGGNDVKVMAMRAGELSPERRRQVMDLLDVVYRLEQAERRGR